MSRTFYLACPETKERLWIGQGSDDNMSTFYSDESYIMACLADFLNIHLNKMLIVVDSENSLFDQLDYKDWCKDESRPNL